MPDHEYLGVRWGYVFLRSASYLALDEIHEIVAEAIKMYYEGGQEKDVCGPDYECKLYRKDVETLGTFYGQRFDAEIETVSGRDHMAFLVSDQTGNIGRFSYSMN